MSSNKNPFEDTGFRWPFQLNLTIKPLAERHFVTLAIILLIIGMLAMARENTELWKVELFKTLLTAMVITGFLNMVVSYHFSANKTDEDKSENTGKAFEAITATAAANVGGKSEDILRAAEKAADDVADAAVVAADKVSDRAHQTEMDFERNR